MHEKVNICDALRDLVPFAQFKKREKHSWRIATFSKAVGLFEVVFAHLEALGQGINDSLNANGSLRHQWQIFSGANKEPSSKKLYQQVKLSTQDLI